MSRTFFPTAAGGCLALGLLLLPTGSAADEPRPCDSPVCASVRFVETDLLEVDLSFAPGAVPVGTRLAFYEEEFEDEDGYGAFVTRDDAPWAEGPAAPRVSYRVKLRHHLAQPRYGLDEVPHPTAGGWFLVGRAFLPRLVEEEKKVETSIELRFELPDGELAASAEGDGNVRHGPYHDLVDSLYYVGEFHRRSVAGGGATILLVSADFDEDALEPLAGLIQRTLELGHGLLGTIPPSRRLFVYEVADRGAGGGVIGRDVTVRSAVPPGTSTAPAASVVIHELMHLWSKSEANWLGEGFTEYFTSLAITGLDASSETEAARRVARQYEAYAAAFDGKPVREARGGWAYSAGATLAFCLDAELRAGPGTTVAEVYAGARGLDEGGVSAERFLDAVGAASAEARGTLERWLQSTELLPVERCFAKVGYSAAIVEYDGYSTRALMGEVLGVRSALMSGPAAVIRSREDSALHTGDRVVALAGTPISNFAEASWALRAVKAGDPIEARVVREGVEITLRWPMPEVDPDQRPRRTRLEVVVDEDVARPLSPLRPGQ